MSKGPGIMPSGEWRGGAKGLGSKYRPELQDRVSFTDIVKKNNPEEKKAEFKEKWKSSKIVWNRNSDFENWISTCTAGYPWLASKSRLMWVEFWGVPLKCWQNDLSLRMGETIGEALMVEEETCKKIRMDRGRVLIAVPLKDHCPDNIEIEVEGSSFVSMVVVDNQPVQSQWLENHLARKREV
ncbi:hypothetical protein Q3G72_029397 [Acer saccharum]|nr:hypothetical protein Q3G72_029397 [Acer saccharum]